MDEYTETDRQRDRWTDGQTYIGNFSPFYWTLSPIGAAAQHPKGRSRPIKRSRASESLTIYDAFGRLISLQNL